MAAAPVSWDKLLRYGPTVKNAASQAWDRIVKWRSSRPAGISDNVEPKEQEEGSLTLEQLSHAVASQSELARQLAEQTDSITNAVSNLASRVSGLEAAGTDAQFEDQTRKQLARITMELSSQAVRSRWAMTIAALAIVLAGVLAVLLLSPWAR